MRTRFGGRQRPSFLIKKWINLGGDGETLPAPTQPAISWSTSSKNSAKPAAAKKPARK